MPNKSHMQPIPEGAFPRSLFLDDHLPELLASLPMASGWSGVADVERHLFPPQAPILPLDPTCPTCGVETDEGRVDIQPDSQMCRILYGCGHVLELSRTELEARLAGQP